MYCRFKALFCRESLKDTVCIPPGNEMLLGGKILKKDRGFQNTGTFLYEPKRRVPNLSPLKHSDDIFYCLL
jgi:hypothetical protein